MKRMFFLLSLFLIGPGMSPARAGSELVSLEVRPGVTMKMMVLVPASSAKGVIVLYAGGEGTLDLGSFFGKPVIGNTSYAQNFLVRVRDKFVDNGYVTVLPDVPSDRKKLDYKYRLSNEQIADAKSTLTFLRSRYPLPVWLAGTSASSMSVAHVAGQLTDEINGIILTASVTQVPSNYAVYGEFPQGTASTNLAGVKVPALVVSNTEDSCHFSPPADSKTIQNRLTNSPRVEVRYFSGGDAPRSEPCNALSRHGFLGIENDVVESMMNFMKEIKG